MPNISTPLANKAYKLCLAIEELPASEQATNLSVQASDLLEEISRVESRIEELWLSTRHGLKKDTHPSASVD